MFRKAALSIVTIGLVSGCANLLTVDRTTKLVPGKDDNGGIAIHLDAKQRLAFQSDFGKVCAEPSPDALSVAASSIGAGVAASDQAAGSFATALTEGGASIGIRTQTVTLMRDALYRVCELYFSRGLNQSQAAQLQRGYQDVITAMLAIEQLTGPVTASQVLLSGAASATATAAFTAVDDQIDDMENTVADKQGAVDTLKTEVAQKSQARSDAATARTTVENDPNATDRDKEGAQRAENTAQTQLEDAQNRLAAAEAELELAQSNLDQLRAAKNNVVTAVSASARTTGQFDPSGGFDPSGYPSPQIADAVRDIVMSIINRDPVTLACVAFLTDKTSVLYVTPSKNNRPNSAANASEVKNMCVKLLHARGLQRTAFINK